MKNSVFLAEADNVEHALKIAGSDYAESIAECLLPFKPTKHGVTKS